MKMVPFSAGTVFICQNMWIPLQQGSTTCSDPLSRLLHVFVVGDHTLWTLNDLNGMFPKCMFYVHEDAPSVVQKRITLGRRGQICAASFIV